MRKIIVIFATVFILAILSFSIGAGPTDSKDISSDIAELKKEVLSLKERVKSLEERLEKATIIIPEPRFRADEPIIRLPDLFRQWRQVPKGWQKREFNGITYYLIPIEQN